MLRDAQRREKLRIVRENFRRRVSAVKIAEQPGNGLDDERIGIAGEETLAVAKLRHKPEFGEAAGNQIFLHAQFRRERRTRLGFFKEKREPVLSVFQRRQLRGKFNLFFREVHGAEKYLISAGWWFFRCGRRRRFIVVLDRLNLARFVTARRTRRQRFAAGWRQFAARRLDAAERAAQLVNLALVGELLALGDLDEFQHFVELVNHLLERLGNLGGVRDGLADGRGFGGAEIGGFDPRLGAQRFRAAVRPAFAGKFALRFAWRPGFRRGKIFGGRFRHRRFRRIGFMRGKISGRLRVRLAEIAGGIGLVMFRVFGGFRWWRVWFNRFRRGRNFFGAGRAGFGDHGTRAAATAATATATAVAAGTGCRRGRFQIG